MCLLGRFKSNSGIKYFMKLSQFCNRKKCKHRYIKKGSVQGCTYDWRDCEEGFAGVASTDFEIIGWEAYPISENCKYYEELRVIFDLVNL